MRPRRDRAPSETVAIILAVGIASALLLVTVAALAAAWVNGTTIGENATQVLTGWGGGMLGVLGAFIGYTFGKRVAKDENGEHDDVPPPPNPPKPPRSPNPGP